MESFPEKSPARIVLNNLPKKSPHEVDAAFNERRESLIPHIQDFISNDERFAGKEISITFSEKGVSSLVAIVETPNEKLVLKIPLSKATAGEGQFLKVWEEAGVKVPHVFEEGVLEEHSYVLMEHIDAEVLAAAYSDQEMIEKEIFIEMGKMLRAMHEPEAEGYGRCIDGKAEYPEFTDWLQGSDVQQKITYAENNSLLGDEHGSLQAGMTLLIDHVKKENKSSYCHDDFGTSNIFATTPITVFDPNMRFNNGYIDLGRSLAITIAHGELAKAVQLIKGYFGDEPFNKEALEASILLNSYMKFPYWHKTKKLKQIERVQKYLMGTERITD